MTDERERHTVYISDALWAELSARVILRPGRDKSRVIQELLDAWMDAAEDVHVPRRGKSKMRTGQPRTIYLRAGLWDQVSILADADGFSVSMLIETLLRSHLGAESP